MSGDIADARIGPRGFRSGKWEEPGSVGWDLLRRQKHSSKANLLLKSRKRGYFGLIFHFRSFMGESWNCQVETLQHFRNEKLERWFKRPLRLDCQVICTQTFKLNFSVGSSFLGGAGKGRRFGAPVHFSISQIFILRVGRVGEGNLKAHCRGRASRPGQRGEFTPTAPSPWHIWAHRGPSRAPSWSPPTP